MIGGQAGRGGGAAGRGGGRGGRGRGGVQPYFPSSPVLSSIPAPAQPSVPAAPIQGAAAAAAAQGPNPIPNVPQPPVFTLPLIGGMPNDIVVNQFADLPPTHPFHTIPFLPTMDSYHGAARIDGRLRQIAELVQRQFMNHDTHYPHVQHLEQASGHDPRPPGSRVAPIPLLDQEFTKHGVLRRDPLSGLWQHFMDDRLFTQAEWRGLTAKSQAQANQLPCTWLTFPVGIELQTRVRVAGPAPPKSNVRAGVAVSTTVAPQIPTTTASTAGSSGVETSSSTHIDQPSARKRSKRESRQDNEDDSDLDATDEIFIKRQSRDDSPENGRI